MIDPSDVEQIAMDVAGQMGGAFLEEKQLTVMPHPDSERAKKGARAKIDVEMTAEEWKEFISVICAGYVQTLTQAEAAAIKAAAKVKYIPN